MHLRNLSLILVASLVVVAAPTGAACTDRPGTPNNVHTRNVTPNSIAFGWTDTTSEDGPFVPHNIFYDIYIRDGARKNLGRDLTGTGPFRVYKGRSSSFDVKDLKPNTTYCFSIRARTEGGTQGCISERNSAWVCAATMAEASATTSPSSSAATPSPAARPTKVLGKHRTVATAKNDVDIYDGPGGEFKVIGVMRAGTKGSVKAKQEGWYRLEVGVPGGAGWVAEDHLTIQTTRPGGAGG